MTVRLCIVLITFRMACLDTLAFCSVGQEAWLYSKFVLKFLAGIKAFVLIKLFLWKKSVLINTSCKVLLITRCKSGHSGPLYGVCYKRMTKLIFFLWTGWFFLLQTDSEEISQLFQMVGKRGKTFIELN